MTFLPCTGVDCQLASHCRHHAAFGQGEHGDFYVVPDRQRLGIECETFAISDAAAAEIKRQREAA